MSVPADRPAGFQVVTDKTALASQYATDNVMAGTDCGFSIHVGTAGVDPDVVWAKLAALAQGAERASRRLWP